MRIVAALLLAATLGACTTSMSDAQTAAPVVDNDEFRITTTVLAVYNVLSGPAGRRDWDRFEGLFAPNARIVMMAADGTATTSTPKEFATAMTPKFNAAASFQRPVGTRVEQYGNIAHVWSTYEGREAANQEQASARGVNSFELIRAGGEWKVLSLLSQPEAAAAR